MGACKGNAASRIAADSSTNSFVTIAVGMVPITALGNGLVPIGAASGACHGSIAAITRCITAITACGRSIIIPIAAAAGCATTTIACRIDIVPITAGGVRGAPVVAVFALRLFRKEVLQHGPLVLHLLRQDLFFAGVLLDWRSAEMRNVIPGKRTSGQNGEEGLDMIRGFVGNFFQVSPQTLDQVIRRVLPIQQLPEVNPGGVDPVGLAAVRVEEDRPVVKLLPQHDEGVGYGFLTRFQNVFLFERPSIFLGLTSRTCKKRLHEDSLSG